MAGPETGVILLRFALGSLGSSMTMVQTAAVSFGLVGLGYSNPGAIYAAGTEFGEAKSQLGASKEMLTAVVRENLLNKWGGEGKLAFDSANARFSAELEDAGTYLSYVSNTLKALGGAYLAFAVFAAGVGVFAVSWAIAVGISAFTPAYPAVKGAAEVALGVAATTTGAATKTLAASGAAGAAVVLAGLGVIALANFEKPGGETGVEDFQQITIDWEPPALP